MQKPYLEKLEKLIVACNRIAKTFYIAMHV